MRGDLRTRFEAKYKIDQKSGCWLWTANHSGSGYGGIRSKAKKLLAHRVSWELYKGPVPDGLCVLHKCDVRLCVNPAHLFLGTKADNAADMVKKGRSSRGERRFNAVLKEADVRSIRAKYAAGGITQQRLAVEFKVSQTTINKIISQKIWSHV